MAGTMSDWILPFWTLVTVSGSIHTGSICNFPFRELRVLVLAVDIICFGEVWAAGKIR